jgi:hypothetical protein
VSNKENKFRPNEGFILAVHQNILYIRRLAQVLDMFPEALAESMEKAGVLLQPDPFDLTADSKKVIELQEREATKGLRVVQEPVPGEEKVDEPSGDTPAN